MFLVSVLPSFSGNVPAALAEIFPSADITRLGNWYPMFMALSMRYDKL